MKIPWKCSDLCKYYFIVLPYAFHGVESMAFSWLFQLYMTFHSNEKLSFHALFIAHNMKYPWNVQENFITFPFEFHRTALVVKVTSQKDIKQNQGKLHRFSTGGDTNYLHKKKCAYRRQPSQLITENNTKSLLFSCSGDLGLCLSFQVSSGAYNNWKEPPKYQH